MPHDRVQRSAPAGDMPTRRAIATWLAATLADGRPTIVGIDHAFSFPLQYFRQHGLRLEWPAFLDDFQAHWPTDEDHAYVDFVRNGPRAAAQPGRRPSMPVWRSRRG